MVRDQSGSDRPGSTAAAFALTHFGNASLGDQRLSKDLSGSPLQSSPPRA